MGGGGDGEPDIDETWFIASPIALSRFLLCLSSLSNLRKLDVRKNKQRTEVISIVDFDKIRLP